MEQEQKKIKPKYDIWFLIVLAVMLWALASQLTSLAMLLPYNLANYTLWFRLIACGLAVYGVIWVFRIYLVSAVRQARKIQKLEEMLKDNPELKAVVQDILKG